MNNFSLNIYQFYIYLLNLRDTLEYTIPHEHPIGAYEQRKRILTEGLQKDRFLDKFLAENGENGEKIRANLEAIVSELYSDDSKILFPEADGVRVDNVQNIHIIDLVLGNAESLRDIIYQYIRYSQEHNENEDIIIKLINDDEHLYRMIVAQVCVNEYYKSFGEFQKVMSESKGQPTPQSNYIVQNDLTKLAGLIRFNRTHTHTIDNKTLDVLDNVNKLLEMCEGRRERTNNASFQDLFKGVLTEIDDCIRLFEPTWKQTFEKVQQEVIESQKQRQYATGSNPSPDTSA